LIFGLSQYFADVVHYRLKSEFTDNP